MGWDDEGNGRDPWGGRGGSKPPELDEVFRKLQSKLGGLFGRGGGGGGAKLPAGGGGAGFGSMFGIALLVFGLWLAYDIPYRIEEGERGVVLRFGKFDRIGMPGLNFRLPRPMESVTKVNVEQVRSVGDRATMLTEDENIVDVDLAVQYKVKNVEDFVFNVRDPDLTLRQAAESAVREVVGSHTMDFAISEGRQQIADGTEVVLQDILDLYQTGLEVTSVNLQDARPPQEVKEAFDDAVKAREDRQRYENEAEAYSNGLIPETRGAAARQIQEAEGYKATVIARADGEAERFTLLLTEYRRAPAVTRERLYLETMETVLGRAGKVIVDVEGGNNIMYLPLDRMLPDRSLSPTVRATPEPLPQSGVREEAGGARPGREDR
jgi:membrane protease subunit HflK